MLHEWGMKCFGVGNMPSEHTQTVTNVRPGAPGNASVTELEESESYSTAPMRKTAHTTGKKLLARTTHIKASPLQATIKDQPLARP